MYNEPKYDEDVVNLGYLNKKILDEEENTDNKITERVEGLIRHYTSPPKPPYNKGDTYSIGEIVYTCINSRKVGVFNEEDWVTESGALNLAQTKNKTFTSQPKDYRIGDTWILQSDTDHKAGKKGEILNAIQNSVEYDEGHWVKDIKYGLISDINQIAEDLEDAITKVNADIAKVEGSITTTYYQDAIPEGILGDLWYVTKTVDEYTEGKIYRFDGEVWKILDDPELKVAIVNANTAQLTADKKIQTYYSDTKPTEGMGVGDLWIDLDDKNKLYRYNGTNWVAVYDTRIDELVVTTEKTSETVAEIQTDLGKITEKVSTVETTVVSVEEKVKKTIKKVDVLYAIGESETVAPTSGWNTVAPAWEDGKYMWQKTVTTYSDDTTTESYATCITGATGMSVKEVIEQYYLSTSNASQKDGEWTETQPEWQENKYIWTRLKTTWADESITYTTPILAGALNTANRVANEALSNQILTATTEETKQFYLPDSADSNCKTVEIFGESTQETRGGTNLFNAGKIKNTKIIVSDNGKAITMPIDTSGNGIVATGSKLSELCPKLKVGDIATLWFDRSLAGYNPYIYLDAPASYLWYRGTTYSITITEDMLNSSVSLYGNRYQDGETEQIILSNFRINLGTELKEWEQYGAMPSPEFPSEIESVSGKNLLNIETSTANKYLDSTGAILDSSTSSVSDYIEVLEGKTYTLSYGTLSDYYKMFCFYDNSKTFLSYYTITNSVIATTITIPKNVKYVRFHYVTANSNVTQFKKSSEATYYVPYNHIGYKSIGENILKGLSTPLTDSSYWYDVNKYYFTPLEDGWGRFSYDNTNGTSTVFINAKVHLDAIELKPNTTYTFITEFKNSSISENANSFFQLATNNPNMAFATSKSLGYSAINAGGVYKSVSKTKESLDNLLVSVDSYLRLATGTKGTVEVRISLVEGDYTNKEYTYEPYKENITAIPLLHNMHSLPNGTRDTIYYKDGKWYDEQKVGQVIFNGSENWGVEGSINGLYRYYIKGLFVVGSRDNAGMSNYFKYEVNYNGTEPHFYLNTAGTHYFFSTITTLAEFKTWLATHNVEVIYELAEPIITEITDPEMINALENIRTFKNITHIEADAPSILTYYRDVPMTEEYETKLSANKKYTTIEERFAEQVITDDAIRETISQTKKQVDEQGDKIGDIETSITEIEKTAEGISSEVSKKVGEDEIISKINQTAEDAQIDANRISLKRSSY